MRRALLSAGLLWAVSGVNKRAAMHALGRQHRAGALP